MKLIKSSIRFLAMFTGMGVVPAAWTGLPWRPRSKESHESSQTILNENCFLHSISPVSNTKALSLKRSTVDVAIIGGGICGVACANALASKLNLDSSDQVTIKIYEGDTNSSQSMTERTKECWSAATERNGNSIGKFE